MADNKIIYEPHPITPERKQELREQGYTIIDARFKPADAKSDNTVENTPKTKNQPKTTKDTSEE